MLVQRVTKIIREHHLLSQGDIVIVGFSGGADSTALLHVLKSSKLDLRLIAVYINHGLRPEETNAEKYHTKLFAEFLRVEYLYREVTVKSFQHNHGCSLEEAARTLRYNALEDIRTHFDAQAIAVAHTADDQVEEFLIRMVRGSGLKGLCGMKYKRGNIIRPFLAEPKATLLEYLAKHHISSCHDSSNDDKSFLRNRIRLNLLPDLEKQYNPSIRTNILQTTTILGEEEDLLEDISQNLYDNLCTVKEDAQSTTPPLSITFLRNAFSAAHPALQRRVLEKICWKMQSRPSFRQLLQLQQLIINGTTGAKLHLSEGLRVRIETKSVVFFHPAGKQPLRGDRKQPPTIEQQITAEGIYCFPEIRKRFTIKYMPSGTVKPTSPETLLINGDNVSFPLVVRSAQPGEKMLPLGAPGRKKISRIFNDLKINIDERPRYPLLVAHDKVVAILGLRIDNSFRCDENSATFLVLIWEDAEN